MSTFSKRLRELRKEKHLRGEDLGKIFNVTKTAISYWENEKTFPDELTIKKMSDYFNVSLDYLLGVSDTRNPEESEGVKLAKQEDFEFDNPEDALKFILGQPSMMAYGGYDLETMPEEEILEIANDILLTLRISIERRRNKKDDKN